MEEKPDIDKIDKKEAFDEAERDIVYHYSRERRLRRASHELRAFNEDPNYSPGLVRRTVGHRSNLFLMISIIMVGAFLTYFNMGNNRNNKNNNETWDIGGNSVIIEIKEIDESLFLVIKKHTQGRFSAYTGPVDFAVSPVQRRPPQGESNPAIEYHDGSFYFDFLEEEVFNLQLPFWGDDFYVILETDKETLGPLRIKR